MGEVASPKSLDAGVRMNELLGFASSGEEIYDRFINPKFKVRDDFGDLAFNRYNTSLFKILFILKYYKTLFNALVEPYIYIL